jgi:8-oxo-dGTP diphosphatase
MWLVKGDRHKLAASGDASECGWFDVVGPGTLPRLAFDHAALLQAALDHLRRRVSEAPLCFELLPDEFTLSELQALLEAILGRALDRRNFRRKVEEIGILAPVPDARREGPHRPAQLYRFVPKAFAAHSAKARLLPF